MPAELDPRLLLLTLYRRALVAVNGRTVVRRALEAHALAGPAVVVALGKAAQAMSEGAGEVLGAQIRGGLAVSKPGHLRPEGLARWGMAGIVGGHPVPTAGSLEAGRRLLEVIEGAGGATLLFLVSGGASSLVEVPAAGLGLVHLRRANRWLLGSGLPIEAVNLIRKAVSRIKGGGLLTWLGGRSPRVLAISDVPGDDPAIIGSGLLVPEPDLARRLADLALPGWLRAWVDQGLAGRTDMPGEGPPIELVATLSHAMQAAAEAAAGLGCPVLVHADPLSGDAAERGRDLGRATLAGPVGVQVWGGETGVRLPAHPGRGGRNQHLALAAACELAGRADCFLLSAGTDGTDGPTRDAGALVDGGTLDRAKADERTAREALRRADAGSLLAAAGDLIATGPTGTNVMDLILGLKL